MYYYDQEDDDVTIEHVERTTTTSQKKNVPVKKGKAKSIGSKITKSVDVACDKDFCIYCGKMCMGNRSGWMKCCK